MPPKKKNQIKAAKNSKVADDSKAVDNSRSKSKSSVKPQDNKKVSPVKTVSPVKAKGKGKGKQPEPTPTPVPVAVTPQPRGRRGARGASTPVVAPPSPAKKVKGQKDPQPLSKSKSKDDAKLSKSKSKNDAVDSTPKVVTKDTAADDQNIVKVITKGGAAVDSFVINKDNYRVFQDAGKVYAATLNQANLDHNNNKFYIVQVLLNQQNGAITVFNRWGRVGVPGQNCMKGPFSKQAAIKQYNTKVHEKTVKGDYREIQIKYDDEDEKPKQQKKQKKVNNNVASKIDPALQRLIGLIFDVTIMNNTMKQIGYDSKKMPLGKLGDKTIREAYDVLNRLTEALKKNQKSQYGKLSGEFYTLIPHDIGFNNISRYILDNQQKVKDKLRMLQAISDMKVTAKLLDQDGDEDTSVYDQNYKKLGCNIKTVDQKSADYKLLKEYFDNTKGASFTNVNIGDIYEVERPTEHTTYDTKLGNNMLLWHGSRVANFVGILSQGLRIAPPEAPVSGYLFGKGIYLADLAEKSIHYCRSHGQPKALILLIEGAIGKPNILLNSSCNAKELMQKNGKNSTKCHGRIAPPESCYVNLNGMIVPNGKATVTNSGSFMGHNEYIVYNMNQARIRYVIEMNMV